MKTKDQAKRAALTRAKKKTKREGKKGFKTPAKKSFPGNGKAPVLEESLRIFWLCHLINHLVSDRDQGLWEPLFEDIYPYNPLAEMPSLAKITTKVMHTTQVLVPAFLTVALKDLRLVDTLHQKILLICPPGDRKSLYSPHNEVVWKLMGVVKTEFLNQQTCDIQNSGSDLNPNTD